MTWVAWRQLRTQALVTLALLAAFAAAVVVTGLHLRDVYGSLGGAHCNLDTCTRLDTHERTLADLLGPALLAVPALLGMFWGAPLVARELETGTYRLAWTQSITRRRWLTIKIALVGVAALLVAGLASWLVSWWFSPLDTVNLNRMDPGVFTARGVVAVGYTAFAFALGVSAGAALRRTLPAMGATLAAFVSARIVLTAIRPHLLAARHALVSLAAGKGIGFISSASGVTLAPQAPPIPNAWTVSQTLVDRANRPLSAAQLHGLLVHTCPRITAFPAFSAKANAYASACQQRLSDHLQQLVTYQPPDHYWSLQLIETAIFLTAAFTVIGLTLWRIGPRSAPDASSLDRDGTAAPSRRRRARTLPLDGARWRRVISRTIAPMIAAILGLGLASCGAGTSTHPGSSTHPASTTTATTRAATIWRSPSDDRPPCTGADAQAPAADVHGGPPLPTTDPFYRWRRPLTHALPGSILRTRLIEFPIGGGAQLRAAQLLYVTTDELGCRTVSVATVFPPVRRPAVTPARILAYQTAYDALGSQCDPSYTLRAGTEGEPGLITRWVDAGAAVVIADYEGEDAAYGVGPLSGYETLDSIRAAERWLNAPVTSTRVGMLGNSGGAVATQFASELAQNYAPRLNIVGTAEGGIPVDLFHELAYIDHPSSPWTGQIPAYFDGLARGFGIRDLNRFFTRRGIAVADADQTRCSGTFLGLTTSQMFTPRYHDVTKIPVFAHIFNHTIMGASGTPRGPLFIANGLSDATGDGVTVTRDVEQLAYLYCHRGVPVQFHIYHGLDHSNAGTPFFAQAQEFLARQLAGQSFHSGCATIDPGNSIAPVPTPAS